MILWTRSGVHWTVWVLRVWVRAFGSVLRMRLVMLMSSSGGGVVVVRWWEEGLRLRGCFGGG